jgi:hypothetical protein
LDIQPNEWQDHCTRRLEKLIFESQES